MLQLRFRVDGISVLIPTTNNELGVLDINTAKNLKNMMVVDPSITFEPYLYWKDSQNSMAKPQLSKIYTISINIYGDAVKLEEVGSALSNTGSYLQEPSFFNEDFKYCNPHVLSWPSTNTPIFLEHQGKKRMNTVNDINLLLAQSATVKVPDTLLQSSSICTRLKT